MRNVTIFAVVLLAIPVGFVAGFWLVHDWENVPLCDKELFVYVENWFDSHPYDSELPNINGRSADSLRELVLDDKQDEWPKKYQYIPGLRRGDPGDLVLAYFKTPTRWKHHAAGPSTIFAERKWVLVPFDFTGINGDFTTRVIREMPNMGEDSERVSLEDLKSRLRNTLKFLQDNDRPHWQTVAAENEAFLRSMEGN